MNLTPKQLAVQEAMLLRLYPGKSLEEAKEENPATKTALMLSSEINRKRHKM